MLSVIESRRARRAIADQPIVRETLDTLLRAAHLAPSCANNQPWRFVVIDDEDVLSQVKEHLTGGNYWAKRSSAIVAVASRADLDCQIPDGRDYHLFGCGLASMNLMLQATELGLIAHPIAGFKQEPIKEVLNIPGDYTLITLIILGYPSQDHGGLSDQHRAVETAPQERLPLSSVLSWNRFDFVSPEDASSIV
jgi:nitroreductase